MSDNIDEKISKILKDTFGDIEINSDLTMDNVAEWDSLLHIRLITSIEDEFKIAIDFADTLEMTSVSEIKNKIQKYLD